MSTAPRAAPRHTQQGYNKTISLFYFVLSTKSIGLSRREVTTFCICRDAGLLWIVSCPPGATARASPWHPLVTLGEEVGGQSVLLSLIKAESGSPACLSLSCTNLVIENPSPHLGG